MASPLGRCDSDDIFSESWDMDAWHRLMVGPDPDIRRCRSVASPCDVFPMVLPWA